MDNRTAEEGAVCLPLLRRGRKVWGVRNPFARVRDEHTQAKRIFSHSASRVIHVSAAAQPTQRCPELGGCRVCRVIMFLGCAMDEMRRNYDRPITATDRQTGAFRIPLPGVGKTRGKKMYAYAATSFPTKAGGRCIVNGMYINPFVATDTILSVSCNYVCIFLFYG